MSYTNSTPNYALPQWIGTDKPTFLGDFNSAFSAIDTQMKANADASTAATATANSAAATATSANTNATTALNTANSAASEAASATSAAASATSTANTASTDAAAALRASAANTIENLAPAYDPTLTYNVGDLVTFIDEQNSGKLYKCIVAVSYPEAFNINKWDDVTTSEVFEAYTKKIIFNNNDYSLTNDLLTAIRNALLSVPDFASRKIDLYYNYDGNYPVLYHLAQIDDANGDNPRFYFSSPVSIPTRCQIATISLGTTNTDITWKMDTNGTRVESTDMTTDTPMANCHCMLTYN